jgi:hypothetical protein
MKREAKVAPTRKRQFSSAFAYQSGKARQYLPMLRGK